MTNKEAIELLNRIAPMPRRGVGNSTTQLLVMEAICKAIKVLEQQPCEDCISREQAIRATYGFERYTGIDEAPYEYAESVLRDLPPVTPKAEPCEDCISRAELLENTYLITDDEGVTHEVVHADNIRYATPMTWSGWKSVTWELPEPNTAVLLYVKYKSSGQWTYQLGMWNDSKLAWEDWRTPYQLEEEFEVIAWMELPERYGVEINV
jgi:hypothetical protein